MFLPRPPPLALPELALLFPELAFPELPLLVPELPLLPELAFPELPLFPELALPELPLLLPELALPELPLLPGSGFPELALSDPPLADEGLPPVLEAPPPLDELSVLGAFELCGILLLEEIMLPAMAFASETVARATAPPSAARSNAYSALVAPPRFRSNSRIVNRFAPANFTW